MDPLNSTAAPGATQPPQSDQSVISSDFETFIKMLTAQMENQDPLNPLDSQDFATQLATFSGVEQQVKTNDLLGALSSQFLTSGLGDMASWVGMDARMAVPAYFDGSAIPIVTNPPTFSERTELVVYNDQGTEVQRYDIPVSDEEFAWPGVAADGSQFPDGTYTFEVVAYNKEEVIDVHTPDVFVTVNEVRAIQGQAIVATDGGHLHPAASVSGLR